MELPSKFQIGDEVSFIPMYKQQLDRGISDDPRDGRIVSITFTEPKVFYDILDRYYSEVFTKVDSGKAWKESYPQITQIEEEVLEPTTI